MRKIKKYVKQKGTKKQIAKLEAINKFRYDLSKVFFDYENKNKN